MWYVFLDFEFICIMTMCSIITYNTNLKFYIIMMQYYNVAHNIYTYIAYLFQSTFLQRVRYERSKNYCTGLENFSVRLSSPKIFISDHRFAVSTDGTVLNRYSNMR